MSDQRNSGNDPLNAAKPRHTKSEWRRKYAERPVCYYCEKPLTFAQATKDHLTPTCRGGADTIDNIAVACLPCNQTKAWRTESEFLAALPGLSTNKRLRAALTKPKDRLSFEERIDEAGLLKKVVSERERVSWAWRNPA